MTYKKKFENSFSKKNLNFDRYKFFMVKKKWEFIILKKLDLKYPLIKNKINFKKNRGPKRNMSEELKKRSEEVLIVEETFVFKDILTPDGFIDTFDEFSSNSQDQQEAELPLQLI